MGKVIVYILIFLIEAFIVWQYLSKIFKTKTNIFFRMSSILIGYGILFYISRVSNVILNIISFLVVNFILIVLLYNVNYVHAIFQSLLITILMCFSELVITTVFSLIYSDYKIYEKQYVILVLEVLLSKFLLFVFLQIVQRITINSSEDERNTDISSVGLLLTPCFSLLIMVMFFHICISIELTINVEYMIIFSSMMLVSINILFFFIFNYNQKKSKEFLQLQIEHQKEQDIIDYYKMLSMQNENQKILIHDIKNHLQTIAILNENGEKDRVSAYVNKLVSSSELSVKHKVCNNNVLNSIINRYVEICKENKIDFCVDIREGVIDFLKDEDITTIFSNLIENAIHASKLSRNKYIDLSVSFNELADVIIISLINSCDLHPMFDDNNKIRTLKDDKEFHGLGLISVGRVTKKYDGNFNTYFDEKEKNFHSIVALKRM